MQWKNEYNIGFDLIDNQHQKLFELASQTEQAIVSGETENTVKAALNELLDYARYHFSSEEQYMQQVKYDDIENHAKMHQDFELKVKSMLKRFHSNSNFNFAELMGLFYDWIIQHILAEDMKLKNFA